jgi:hypothetical protein
MRSSVTFWFQAIAFGTLRKKSWLAGIVAFAYQADPSTSLLGLPIIF